MAQAKLTNVGREKLCKAHAGDGELPRITHMAFGDGGVDESGNIVLVIGNETSLRNELLKKEIDSHDFPRENVCRYTTALNKGELVDKAISEIGLYDAEGDLVIYRTSKKLEKDEDSSFTFHVVEVFLNEGETYDE